MEEMQPGKGDVGTYIWAPSSLFGTVRARFKSELDDVGEGKLVSTQIYCPPFPAPPAAALTAGPAAIGAAGAAAQRPDGALYLKKLLPDVISS